jgi:hypothetical protein
MTCGKIELHIENVITGEKDELHLILMQKNTR